jgi:hypothetical protein
VDFGVLIVWGLEDDSVRGGLYADVLDTWVRRVLVDLSVALVIVFALYSMLEIPGLMHMIGVRVL